MHQVRSFTTHSLAALLEAGIIALIVLTLVAAPALAGRGGSGNTNGGGSTATLTVEGAPVDAYGAEYIVTGTGFKPNTPVNIVISLPGCCAFFTVMADDHGTAWFKHTTGDPGTYTVEAHQRLNGKKLTLVGRTTFEVTGP